MKKLLIKLSIMLVVLASSVSVSFAAVRLIDPSTDTMYVDEGFECPYVCEISKQEGTTFTATEMAAITKVKVYFGASEFKDSDTCPACFDFTTEAYTKKSRIVVDLGSQAWTDGTDTATLFIFTPSYPSGLRCGTFSMTADGSLGTAGQVPESGVYLDDVSDVDTSGSIIGQFLSKISSSPDTYAFATAAGGGSGTMTTVKHGGVQVGDSDITTLDFFLSEFLITESPDKEINIEINSITSSQVSDFDSSVTTVIENNTEINENTAARHDAITLNSSATTGGMSLSTQEISNQAASNAQNGYSTAAHIAAIEANTADSHASGSDDEDAASIAAINHGTAEKSSLVDADEITGQDSADTFSLIRTTWTSIKAFLKTYFDTLYEPIDSPVELQFGFADPENWPTDAERGTKSHVAYKNTTGASLTLAEIQSNSDVDNYTWTLFKTGGEYDFGTANDVQMEVVACSTDRTSRYSFGTTSGFDNSTLEDGRSLTWQHTSGTAGDIWCYIKLE